MNTELLFSVILPTYNDTQFLRHIVREVGKSPWCGEIIVVDDGSLPIHKKVLASLKNVILCTHPQNAGKAAALRTGLNHARFRRCAFIDTDLRTFKTSHLNIMIETLEAGSFDMVIGSREKEVFATMLLGFSQAYTGERVFANTDELRASGVLETHGYLVEPRINEYYFHTKRVGIANLQGLEQTIQIKKQGFRKGMERESRLVWQYVSALGPTEFLFQLAFVKKIEAQDLIKRLRAEMKHSDLIQKTKRVLEKEISLR